jgi:hypothetical protein
MSIAAMDMVFVAYETILERYPDQDGFAFWVDSISNTNPTTPEAWYEESTHLTSVPTFGTGLVEWVDSSVGLVPPAGPVKLQ